MIEKDDEVQNIFKRLESRRAAQLAVLAICPAACIFFLFVFETRTASILEMTLHDLNGNNDLQSITMIYEVFETFFCEKVASS